VAVDGRLEEDEVEEDEDLERERLVDVGEVAARGALHERGVARVRVLDDCVREGVSGGSTRRS